jgi:hypothetical protein
MIYCIFLKERIDNSWFLTNNASLFVLKINRHNKEIICKK